MYYRLGNSFLLTGDIIANGEDIEGEHIVVSGWSLNASPPSSWCVHIMVTTLIKVLMGNT